MLLDAALIQNDTSPMLADLYLQYGRERSFTKNTNIITAGDEVTKAFYIKKGICAYIYVTPGGNNRAFSLLMPGSSCGEAPAITEKASTVNVTCLENTVALELPAWFILEKARNMELYREIMTYVIGKYRGLYEGQALAATLNIPQRLAMFFKCCTVALNPDREGWYTIKIKLTHERLGEVVSANRVTVTLLLNHLKDKGLVRMEKGHILVKDQMIEEGFIENELGQTNWSNIRPSKPAKK